MKIKCIPTARQVLLLLSILFIQNLVAQKKQQPNIVLIMLDDVSPEEFGCYQQPDANATPNIDKLAADGVMFKTCYAASMCAPSRIEIMTGKYGSSTGVLHNSMWLNDRKSVYKDNQAFGKLLKEAGYATAIAGKWHAGATMPYEESVGFEEYCLWEFVPQIEALPGSPKFTGLMENEETTSRYWHPGIIKNHKMVNTKPSDFGPDIFAEFIMDFIERKTKEGKPFLAYWPSVAPHGSRTGYPTNPHRGEVGDLGERTNKKENRLRFKSLNEYMDHLVGRVVKKINDLGIAENTMIIFTSDNGTAATAKTRGVERGCHVVNIMSGGGVKKRGATNELTDFTDIAPTLLDFAGGKLPEGKNFDGISLKPFLTGQSNHTKDWIYGFISTSQIVRTKDYMLEAVNPFLNYPDGRFYYTGEHRFGSGYEFVNNKDEYKNQRGKFTQFLEDFPAITKEHPYWQTKSGQNFSKTYTKPASVKKHLFNHIDYKFYDEGLE